MNCQGSDLNEFLSTDPALVRFVSSVLPGVFLHVVLPSEGLPAPTAGELLLLLLLSLRLRFLSVLGYLISLIINISDCVVCVALKVLSVKMRGNSL